MGNARTGKSRCTDQGCSLSELLWRELPKRSEVLYDGIVLVSHKNIIVLYEAPPVVEAWRGVSVVPLLIFCDCFVQGLGLVREELAEVIFGILHELWNGVFF